MKITKKIFSILLLSLYWYNQSVFSHLLIIEQHHDVKVVSQTHMHEDGSIHPHESKSIENCKDSDCETTCENIEHGKLSCQYISKDFLTDYIEANSDQISIIKNYFNFYDKPIEVVIYPKIGPPISQSILMPRIGVVVRVI